MPGKDKIKWSIGKNMFRGDIRLGKKGATDENVIQLNKKIWEVTLNEKY